MIRNWAKRWGLPEEALAELYTMPRSQSVSGSEAGVVNAVRLEASRRGARLWRNNVGAARDVTDRYIRYGLANESAQSNKTIKSSDLIGITEGVFTSYECKHPGWKYTGSPHEQAQLAWLVLINRLGGIGRFVTGPEDIR